MRQFIRAGDTAFVDLERRARRACVVYHDQELPPGAHPSRARVGFEINPADGSAILLVDRGVAYTGNNPATREWLAAGEKKFRTFVDLQRWLRETLCAAYGADPSRPSTTHSPLANEPPPRADELTDLDAVRREMPHPQAPLYLDEGALYRELTKYVRGQDDALHALAGRVTRHVARQSPRRPATIFAIGPTGVGKTKTAESLPLALRALATEGAGYSYLRLDMSEYQERYRVSQLLGAPQGYVGYGEGAQLIDALAANPRTVVLFDEIEKAHRDVLKALMNAMDAGRLSTAADTGQGREIDCRFAIFMFTTNLDAGGILKELTERDAFGNRVVEDQVCRNHMRANGVAPELVGRIGCFLVFRPLSAEATAEIVALAIARVAEEYGLRVGRIEPGVIVSILEEARSEGFGARPYESLVDELMGACFAGAVAADLRVPVEVCGGPPLEIRLIGARR